MVTNILLNVYNGWERAISNWDAMEYLIIIQQPAIADMGLPNGNFIAVGIVEGTSAFIRGKP